MRPILVSLLLLWLAPVVGYSQGLSAEARADMYTLEAKAAVEQQQYGKAVEAFEKIERLGIDVPEIFSYFYGKSLLETWEIDRAIGQLQRYISTAGSSGKFYLDALELYRRAESLSTSLDGWPSDQRAKQAERLFSKKGRRVAVKVCNRTSLPKITLAVGYPYDDHYLYSQGWWAIKAEECLNLHLNVRGDNFYFYATSGDYSWRDNNNISFCAPSRVFAIAGKPGDCGGERTFSFDKVGIVGDRVDLNLTLSLTGSSQSNQKRGRITRAACEKKCGNKFNCEQTRSFLFDMRRELTEELKNPLTGSLVDMSRDAVSEAKRDHDHCKRERKGCLASCPEN